MLFPVVHMGVLAHECMRLGSRLPENCDGCCVRVRCCVPQDFKPHLMFWKLVLLVRKLLLSVVVVLLTGNVQAQVRALWLWLCRVPPCPPLTMHGAIHYFYIIALRGLVHVGVCR